MRFQFFSSPILVFPNQQFYTAKQYIHMTKESTVDSLFVLAEAIFPAAGAGGIGALAVGGNNRTDGVESNDAPNLRSVRILNLSQEDMAELLRQGIAIDDDKYPAPDNVPRQGETNAGTGNWRREGIIFHRKSGNLQNYFASFRHYSRDSALHMSPLQLLLIMFPEEYIEKVLIHNTNKDMSVPMDHQDCIKWVVCWIYISCWVGIESRQDWWSTTTTLMAKGAPFRLNIIMSRNRFDYILGALCFTNREVP